MSHRTTVPVFMLLVALAIGPLARAEGAWCADRLGPSTVGRVAASCSFTYTGGAITVFGVPAGAGVCVGETCCDALCPLPAGVRTSALTVQVLARGPLSWSPCAGASTPCVARVVPRDGLTRGAIVTCRATLVTERTSGGVAAFGCASDG